MNQATRGEKSCS